MFHRPAAFLGLVSSLFAAICLAQVIYLYVRGEVQQQPPHLLVLCVFGVKGAIGMSLGIGAFVAFLGLGIIDSINHVGEFLQQASIHKSYIPQRHSCHGWVRVKILTLRATFGWGAYACNPPPIWN